MKNKGVPTAPTDEQVEAELKALEDRRKGLEPAAPVVVPPTPKKDGEDGQPKPAVPAPDTKPDEKPVAPPPPEPAPAATDAEKQVAELKAQVAALQAEKAEIERQRNAAQGQYGGKLEDLRGHVRDLTEAFNAMKAENVELKKAAAEKPVAPVAVPDKALDALTAGLPEDDATSLKALFANQTAQLAQAMKRLEEMAKTQHDISASAEQQAVQRYNESLYGAVPDFDAVNGDPKFAAFINTPDEYGNKLVDTLQRAVEALNPKPIITAVSKFRATQTAPQPTAEEAAAAQQAEAEKKAKLAASGAPSPAAAGARKTEPTPEQKAQARREWLAAMHKRIMAGDPAITADERARYERESDEETEQKLAATRRR